MNLAKEYYQRNNIKVPLVDFSKYGFLILKAKSSPDSVLWSFFRVEKVTRNLMPPCYLFERYSIKLDAPATFSSLIGSMLESHPAPPTKKHISPHLQYHRCLKYNSHFVSLYFNVEKRCYFELEEYENCMFNLAKAINPSVVVSEPDAVKISALQIFITKNQKEICKIGQNKVRDMSIVFDEKTPQASKLLMYSMCSNGNTMDATMKKKWIEFKRVIVEGYNHPFAEFLKSF